MHEKFMAAALKEAELALREGEFPVGCVIVENTNVIAQGRRVNSFVGNELDHAEMVALRSLHTKFPEAAQKDLTVYATMEPCLMCFAALLLNNVKTIVYAYEDVMGGGTTLPLNLLKPLYSGMEVEIIPGIMREESLKLFKKFFEEDQTGYWCDSYLAEFTLKQ
ncbi:MAG: nucleoside deaminase [Desulfocapsaceae bacterium]|nr:nucleoside deaminase [Desulfocapsaceae bacterium]